MWALWLACASAPAPPPAWGQWVWTDADAAPLAEARAVGPVTAGVLIAELHDVDGAPKRALRLRPTLVDGPRAVVVRLDDDLHGDLERDPAAFGRAVAAELAALDTMVTAVGGAPVEWQLDYDVPVRLLPAWANALDQLPGPRPWVTSLVSQVEDPRYGPLLHDRVAGHLLQVFDTGEPVDPARVRAAAERAGLPWRLAVGAFERGGAAPTHHAAWFAQRHTTCVAPACTGVWVFPAGRGWIRNASVR